MTDLAVLLGAFAATVAAIQIAAPRKLQSAFGPVVVIHGVGFLASLLLIRTVGPSVAFVFWAGMFAAWFGLRSHVESSILLWMVHFLRNGPSTRDEILGRYHEVYGRTARIAELTRAGLVAMTPAGIAPTWRGRALARIATFLR